MITVLTEEKLLQILQDTEESIRSSKLFGATKDGKDIISTVEVWNGVALIKELHKLHTESKGSINYL